MNLLKSYRAIRTVLARRVILMMSVVSSTVNNSFSSVCWSPELGSFCAVDGMASTNSVWITKI